MKINKVITTIAEQMSLNHFLNIFFFLGGGDFCLHVNFNHLIVLLCETHIFPILHMTRVSQIILQNNVFFYGALSSRWMDSALHFLKIMVTLQLPSLQTWDELLHIVAPLPLLSIHPSSADNPHRSTQHHPFKGHQRCCSHICSLSIKLTLTVLFVST